ncbi:MAG: phosphoribosyltransferase family protein [Candidatus Micrarchaeia archaeon]
MLEIIGLILGLIGAISSLWYIYEKLLPGRRLSWRFAQKAAKRIAEELTADDFSPTIIIGISRGGAIMGALISGCLGHRPLVVIDPKYTWKEGYRFDDMIFNVDIPQNFLEKVLLVSGEVHSGNTMKFYYEHFKKVGAKSIRRATLYYEKMAPIKVEYKGLESTKQNILMPWMFTKQYIREDRYPPKNTTDNSG